MRQIGQRDEIYGIVHLTSARLLVSPLTVILVMATALTFFSVLTKADYAQTAETLSQVKKVYVGSLGDKQGATGLRDKLIQRLRRTSAVEIAPSPKAADAIITGTSEIWIKGYVSASPKPSPWNRQPLYDGYLSVELKGKDNETLWSYRATPGKLLWNGVDQDLVNRLTKKLLAALRQNAGVAH